MLATERAPGLVEPFFSLALQAAERWSPTVLVPRRLARVAEVAARRAAETDHRTAALNTLARSASTPGALRPARPRGRVQTSTWRGGCWPAGRPWAGYDEEAVQALLERDPDPDAELRAFAVAAAVPSAEAKAEAWARVFDERAVPAGPPLQRDGRRVLAPGPARPAGPVGATATSRRSPRCAARGCWPR